MSSWPIGLDFLTSIAPGNQHAAIAKEVSHWADLPLEFVLIGLDGCGTTSLRRNLAKHPVARTKGIEQHCSTVALGEGLSFALPLHHNTHTAQDLNFTNLVVFGQDSRVLCNITPRR